MDSIDCTTNFIYFAIGTGALYNHINKKPVAWEHLHLIDAQSRLREGGLWRGALGADIAEIVREKRNGKPLVVYGIPEQLAMSALAGLEALDEEAIPLYHPREFDALYESTVAHKK